MELAKEAPRLPSLQDRLQNQEHGLRGFRWLGTLLRWSKGEQGGDGVSGGNGNCFNTERPEAGQDGRDSDEPESHGQSSEPASTQGESQTEEFLALLPNDFPAEGLELGLNLVRQKRKRMQSPAYVAGRDVDPGPYMLGSDWRRHAPPDSKAYQDAIDNPTNGLDQDVLKIVIDMGIPGTKTDW
jgi:hypothetical protein